MNRTTAVETADYPARRSRNRSANGAQVDSPGQSPGSSVPKATSPQRATHSRSAHKRCFALSGLDLVGRLTPGLRYAAPSAIDLRAVGASEILANMHES